MSISHDDNDYTTGTSYIVSWEWYWIASDHVRLLRASPFPRLWLCAGLWADMLVYKYQFQLSCGTGSVLSYNLAHWAGTHFRQPYCLIHGSGQVCLGSSGIQLRPSAGKPAFISHELRRHSLSLRKPTPQVLTLSGGARFIAWCLRCLFLGECQQDSRHFWNNQTCVGYSPAPGPYKKRPCAILMCMWDAQQVSGSELSYSQFYFYLPTGCSVEPQ